MHTEKETCTLKKKPCLHIILWTCNQTNLVSRMQERREKQTISKATDRILCYAKSTWRTRVRLKHTDQQDL